jgi:type IV pilus assembly protein PilM
MAKKKITLYIEDTDIKLLVSKGKQIDKWASLLLEPSLVRDGVIVDEEQVAESIKTLLKLGEVKQKKISIGLSGLNSIFRIITLPEMSPSLLPEAILNEARRVIPVPLDQVYLSHQKIPSSPGENRIFLVAYPRNSTDILIKTLQKAGLKLDTMDLAPLALARCANETSSVIINSWLTYLDVIIMTDKLPQVIRSLSLPTEAVDINEKLPLIAEELSRTIAFYNSSNPSNQLDNTTPVFVCGDIAEAPDSWEKLVAHSGYKVSILAPPIEYPETFSPCKFMVNIGLALKGQLPDSTDNYYSIIDFNATPEAYKPKAINITRIIVPVAIVIGIGALAYGGLLIKGVSDDTVEIKGQTEELDSESELLRLQIASTKNDIEIQDEELALFPGQAAEFESMIESKEILNASFNLMLDGLSEGLVETDANIKEIVDLLPVTVILNKVAYDGELLNISGNAVNEDDVLGYARALRSSERFEDVTVLTISEILVKESEEEIKIFDFTFLVK